MAFVLGTNTQITEVVHYFDVSDDCPMIAEALAHGATGISIIRFEGGKSVPLLSRWRSRVIGIIQQLVHLLNSLLIIVQQFKVIYSR
jgi:hypothetical protein